MSTFFSFIALRGLTSTVSGFVALISLKRKKRSRIACFSSASAMLIALLWYAPYGRPPLVEPQPTERPKIVVSKEAEGLVQFAAASMTPVISAFAGEVSSQPQSGTPDFPDPILGAHKPSTVMCDTEDELLGRSSIRAGHEPDAGKEGVKTNGCESVSGRHVVKVVKLDGSMVQIKVTDSEGVKSGYVWHDDLSSADERERPRRRYVVIDEATVVCRRTTDFDEALKAAKELDVDWFRSSPTCKITHKGDLVFMIKNDAPYDKVCIGSENDCFLGWIPFTSVDEVKDPPAVIAKGRLRICWPSDIPREERPADLTLPVGVIFLDGGQQDREHDGDRGRNGTIMTTKKVLLRKLRDCVVAPADLLDDPDAPWDRPAVRQATVAARRYYVPDSIITSPKSGERQPLPDTFAMTPLGYIESDFR